MFRLTRPFDRYAQIVGLCLSELGQVNTDFSLRLSNCFQARRLASFF